MFHDRCEGAAAGSVAAFYYQNEEGLPSYHHLIFYLIPIHLRVSGKIYLINRQMFENKEVGNEPEKICACFGHPDRFCS